MNKKQSKSPLSWCHHFKTLKLQDTGHWEQIYVVRDRWETGLDLLVSTNEVIPIYPQIVLGQINYLLQRANINCISYRQTNSTRCHSTKVLRFFQKFISSRHGRKGIIVVADIWNSTQRQTSGLSPMDFSTFTTQRFLESAKSGMFTKKTERILDAILKAASKNALQNFTQDLTVSSNANKGPGGYTDYALRTDLFLENMICPSYFDNSFVHTFGTKILARKLTNLVSLFVFVKVNTDLTVNKTRRLDVYRLTRNQLVPETFFVGKRWPFMASILKSTHSPAKPIESPKPVTTGTQESTKQIYPFIQTHPENDSSTCFNN